MTTRPEPSRAELRTEYRRRVFQVFSGDEWMCSYGDMYFMQPEAPSDRATLFL